jgi:SOS-response transcriptional repressor LexA
VAKNKNKKEETPEEENTAPETVTGEVIDEQPEENPIESQLAAEKEKFLRLAAEYDNYRKRSAKEREAMYADVRCDTATQFLPVYDLKAACGYFEENTTIPENEAEGWVDISQSGIKINKNMFVIYAAGDSMLPKIKDGDLCVFELYGPENGGSREGKIVLTECRDKDTDTDCHYTIKKYHSTWHNDEEGRKIHDTVELIPLNTDEYETRILQSGEEYRTVGIFKCVL